MEAIASVQRQTYADWEAIVVDDGSDNPSSGLVEGLAEPRVRYLYQRNAGLAAARNAGIRLSSGQCVAFLDDDDVWLPSKLELQMGLLSRMPAIGLASGGWLYIDQAGKAIKEAQPWLIHPELDLRTWLYACPAVPSAVLVRREWLTRAGGFDEHLSRKACGAEDWDLWLRLAHLGCAMEWVEEALCSYRVSAGSMVRQARRQRDSTMLVLDKFFAASVTSADIAVERERIYGAAHLRGAAREYAAGQVDEAREDVARALVLDPDLLARECERLFGALVGWAGDPVVGDPVGYIRAVFGNLPPEAAGLVEGRRDAIARAAKEGLFQAYWRHDRDALWRNLAALAVSRPALLLDRGVASVTFRALGRTAASAARRLCQHARSGSHDRSKAG